MSTLNKVPILRTLQVSTRKSRENARAELFWNIGFAFIPVVVVVLIVVLSKPIGEAPAQVLSTVGRGELMVYAASVCGAILYTLRHSLNGPLPDAVTTRTTSVGTLSTLTVICMFVAISSYLVRRMSDIHHLALNEPLLTWSSLIVLILSVMIAYVVFSLKYSLVDGGVEVAREADTAFAAKWDRSKDA